MNNWATKICLPLLLLAIAVAVYFEFSSVKTIELDSGYSTPRGNAPLLVQSPQLDKSPTQSSESRAKSRLVAGERYRSLEELVADQQAVGYLKTGYFGMFWPATVTEIKSAHDGIVFRKQDGTKHTYTGFEGYRMKMVRLSGGGDRETIVIFRSANKR